MTNDYKLLKQIIFELFVLGVIDKISVYACCNSGNSKFQ